MLSFPFTCQHLTALFGACHKYGILTDLKHPSFINLHGTIQHRGYVCHLRPEHWSFIGFPWHHWWTKCNHNNAPKSSADSTGVSSFPLLNLWCWAVPCQYQLGKQEVMSRGIQEQKWCTVMFLLLLAKWSGFRNIVRILLPCQPSKRDAREIKVTEC